MFAGILYGAMYGGSTSSILLNTPGESGSIITALEGNRMARNGRGAAALATAAMGSFVAGTIGTILLTFLAAPITELAFLFGPSEYFALMVLAFTTVSVVLGASLVRGFISLFLGLALGVVGIDAQTGQARLTFGSLDLLDGIPFMVVLSRFRNRRDPPRGLSRRRESKAPGSPSFGWCLDEPGGLEALLEAVVARNGTWAFLSGFFQLEARRYQRSCPTHSRKRLTRNPEEFGNGAIEGVAGPEAANNAAAAGVLVPLLTLGLPTSATAAVLLSAFQSYGLQPGPLLFTNNASLVWAVVASLYIGNVMLLVLNLPLAGVWARLLLIPQPHLYAGIAVFSLIGVWGLSTSWFHLLLMTIVGTLGFVMRSYGFPIAPVLIELILGPMAEQQLRRALAISQGDPAILVSSPISATLIGIAAVSLVIPAAFRRLSLRSKPRDLSNAPVAK